MIKTASPEQMDIICEVLLNVIKGTVTIPSSLVQKAKKFTNAIRQLTRRYLSKPARKRLMLKYMPIIKTLLSTAVPLCTMLLTADQLGNG